MGDLSIFRDCVPSLDSDPQAHTVTSVHPETSSSRPGHLGPAQAMRKQKSAQRENLHSSHHSHSLSCQGSLGYGVWQRIKQPPCQAERQRPRLPRSAPRVQHLMCSPCLTSHRFRKFKKAFHMIDQNRGGLIDKKDLHDVLASLGKNPMRAYLDAMMNEVSGPINFTMFLRTFGEQFKWHRSRRCHHKCFCLL